MNPDSSYSYWEKESFLAPYDLVVIGAGIVGFSAAIFYKRAHPDSRVVILEKGYLPEGASTRNAGFACIGSITEHVADLEKESEKKIKDRLLARYEGLHLLRDLLGDEHIGYRPCGGYELFTGKQNFEKAADCIPIFNDWMNELAGEDKVYSSGKLNGYHVIHNRLEGALHPGKMMRQFIRLAAIEEVEIKWNSNVTDVDREGTAELTDGNTYRGNNILIACNGFTKRLLPEINIQPARGYVFVTNELQEMPWKGTFHYNQGFIYFRDLGSRLLIGGGRNVAPNEEETDKFGTNEAIRNYLKTFVSDTLKLNSDWQIEQEWSGIMGFTQTKTPLVKKINEYCTVAAGLSGMGVAIGTRIGKKAADLLS